MLRMLKSLGEHLDLQFEELERRPWLTEELDPELPVSTVEARLAAVENEAPGD